MVTISDKPPLRILVATWNVGNVMPPKDPHKIREWIPEGGGDFDVIAIGLQESSYRERAASVSSDVVSCSVAVDAADSTDTSDGAVLVEAGDYEVDDAADLEACGNDSPTRPDPSRSEWECEYGEFCYDDGEDQEDEELVAALAEAHQAAREALAPSSPRMSPTSPEEEEQDATARTDNSTASATGGGSRSNSLQTGEVIIKRSRTKKSIRKVSKLVRQVSSNLRESVADALDYPFNKQLYHHLGEDYGLVGKVELMEMRLFVYVHSRHTVSGIEKISVPTGLGSVLGNKVRTLESVQAGEHAALATSNTRRCSCMHSRVDWCSSSWSKTRRSAS